MKNFLFVTLFVLSGLSGTVFAVPILTYGTHNNPYEYSTRWTAWDENIESESSAVTKVGSYFNFNVASVDWGKGTWLFSQGSYVEIAFSVDADTLFTQFQSDTNDGIAEFWVDGALIGSIDTLNRIWFQAQISGLNLGTHTMRIYSRRNSRGQDDLSFDNFGALKTSQIPAPDTLVLIGFGLVGLGMTRKRKPA